MAGLSLRMEPGYVCKGVFIHRLGQIHYLCIFCPSKLSHGLSMWQMHFLADSNVSMPAWNVRVYKAKDTMLVHTLSHAALQVLFSLPLTLSFLPLHLAISILSPCRVACCYFPPLYRHLHPAPWSLENNGHHHEQGERQKNKVLVFIEFWSGL